MPLPTNTPEEVIEATNQLTTAMKEPPFAKGVRASLDDRGMPSGLLMMSELEKAQVRILDDLGYNGEDALNCMKGAVKKHGQGVRPAIVALCDIEEAILTTISEELGKKFGVENHPMAAPSPQQQQQQMQLMQMAMQSLTPEQQDAMKVIQTKMMSGQVPTPEEQAQAAEIRQHVQAYIMTMQQMFSQAGAPPAAQ